MENRATPRAEARSIRDDALVFLAIAAFAFLLRYVHLLQARSVPLFDAVIMDGLSYSSWADRIVAGDWVGDRVFYQAPLYPYFLAVVKLAVGNDLWRIRLVQIAIGSLACGILFLAGRAFFSRGVGILAGVLLALYPPAIFFDGLIQKANLGLLWTVLLLWALARARFVLAGIALALLMLTREETVLLVFVLAAWALFAPRERPLPQRARQLLGFAAGLAVVLTPVVWRNHAVGGGFVLTTSQAGSNFYIGNNAQADGTYVPLVPGRQNTEYERKDAFDLAERDLGRKLTPSEVSSYWFGKARAWITSHPIAWTRLMATKFALLVNAYELPDYEDMYFYERSCALLRGLDAVWNFGVLVPIAAAGLVLTWARRRELLVLYLVLGTLASGVVLFYVFARYRYPLVPVLVLFAAAGIAAGASLVRARRGAVLLPAIVALGVAAAVSNWPLRRKDDQLAASLSNAAAVLASKKEDGRAVDLYLESLRVQPDAPEVLGNLGLALMRLQRVDEAIAAFRHAADLRPTDWRAWMRLAAALDQTGRVDDATPCIVRALELDAQNTLDSALLLVRQGSGRDLVALDILAAAEAKVGRFEDAVATATRALESRPATGQEALAAKIRERLDLYRRGEALR
ncbi:MAG TPA: tetratricopeptide repeat protein [Planctomycetota bacterium]|jgi:tetratricopeptide (TPR) repeat protein|nr:tetratricopeptide repeat protein [Planctomycetota bacterium]